LNTQTVHRILTTLKQTFHIETKKYFYSFALQQQQIMIQVKPRRLLVCY